VITPDAIMANPGLLKLDLMRQGAHIESDTLAALHQRGYRVEGHGPFGGVDDVDLVLGQDTWVSVPLVSNAAATPYRIRLEGEGYAVVRIDSSELTSSAGLAPRSHVFEHTTKQGLPFGRFGTVHGPYLALSPTNRCTFLPTNDRCRFCGVVAHPNENEGLAVEDVLEAIRIARAEHPVNIVYLSIGYLSSDDGGVAFLEPYVRAIKKHFDILVSVDALPPKDNGWIDRTYGMGVDAVSYNLEIFDEDLFKKVCPGPSRVIGRERFLEALEYATTVFPSGGVTCHLIVGLEPLESTHAGIDALTRMGVLPVLPVFRPFKGRDMRSDLGIERYEPSFADMVDVYAHLYDRVKDEKLSLNLVRDISIVTTPLDARFFAAPPTRFQSLFHRALGTRFARRTSAYLSDLRRNLRVREVSADNG
jgi:solute carrier family 13 (sodium-dependent dicarboxylate transporter), member 2/3/5